MLNYLHFRFAAPPGVGSTWFILSMWEAGVKAYGYPGDAYIPFGDSIQWDTLKVSLVRHPLDWLAHQYLERRQGSCPPVEPFDDFRVSHFDNFVEDYLEQSPGGVGDLYARYNADTVMRIEDMPGAFYEFMTSLGLTTNLRRHGLRAPRLLGPLPEWNPRLREKVARAEAETLERYDYYA